MEPNTLHWFKSSYSSAESSACVEVALDHWGSRVRVRDSLAPRAGNLAVSRGEWSVLVRSLGADAVEE